MPQYIYIRAMDQSQACFDLFSKNSIVAVGYSDFDFTTYPSTQATVDAVKAVAKGWGWSAQTLGKKMNEVRRFLSLKPGDKILVPRPYSVWLAEVTTQGFVYSKEAFDMDLSNQVHVEFKKTADGSILEIPRTQLPEGLQSRLRMRGSTCVDVGAFAKDIENLFQGVRREDVLARKRESIRDAFRKEMLSRLQSGKTYLKTGGRGLEELVCELLRIEGFQAQIMSKRAFPGGADADIKAVLDQWPTERKILVQVKHHQGNTGSWGIEQLQAIQEVEEYAEYERLLVTSGSLSKDLKKLCKENGFLDPICGDELVEWIHESLPKLSAQTLQELQIEMVPQFLD